MTNGAGGPHGHKRGKVTGKKGHARETKASAKRKAWVSAAVARGKNQ